MVQVAWLGLLLIRPHKDRMGYCSMHISSQLEHRLLQLKEKLSEVATRHKEEGYGRMKSDKIVKI